MEDRHFRVGVGVAVFKEGKVLLGERLKEGKSEGWSCPGGHVELGESLEECAMREVLEETGVEIENVRLQFLTSIPNMGNKHFLSVGFLADWKSGEPQLTEPDLFKEWHWYSPEEFPESLFGTAKDFLESHRTGRTLFDFK